MSTIFRLAGAVTLMIGMQLIASGAASAATRFEPSANSAFGTMTSSLNATSSSSSKPGADIKGDYVPPPDIGGPGSSQGSGTR